MKWACPSEHNIVAPRATCDTVNEEEEDIGHDALNDCYQDTVYARLQGADVVTFGDEPAQQHPRERQCNPRSRRRIRTTMRASHQS